MLTLLAHSLFAGSLIAAPASVLLTFVNYFKVLITSVPLSLGDFSLIGQVGDIASLNASAITFGRNSILAVAAVVVWLAVVWFFSKPLRIEWRWSLVGAAGGAWSLPWCSGWGRTGWCTPPWAWGWTGPCPRRR